MAVLSLRYLWNIQVEIFNSLIGIRSLVAQSGLSNLFGSPQNIDFGWSHGSKWEEYNMRAKDRILSHTVIGLGKGLEVHEIS